MFEHFSIYLVGNNLLDKHVLRKVHDYHWYQTNIFIVKTCLQRLIQSKRTRNRIIVLNCTI